jgi:hypothetical protein
MAKEGIEKYWTRDGSRNYAGDPSSPSAIINAPINTAKGTYTVKVEVNPNVEPKAVDFLLYEVLESGRDTNNKYTQVRRSTSAPGFKAVYHLAGYYFHNNFFNNVTMADPDFQATVAHEFGHIILMDYGDIAYSWSHDSTSKIITQSPMSGLQHHYPIGNLEVNIMHYHDQYEPKPEHWYRATASETDVKGLLWLCRVKFND